MATRANIAIVLNSEDRNKPLNFMSDRFNEVRPHLGMDLAEEVQEECNFVDVMSPKVLQIYNHNDGYPDHLGYILRKYYNTYEKALALILAGDTSSVDDDRTVAYCTRDGYERVTPRCFDHPTQYEEYLYTFIDGEWKVGEDFENLNNYI